MSSVNGSLFKTHSTVFRVIMFFAPLFPSTWQQSASSLPAAMSGKCNQLMDECRQGGPEGCLGIDQQNWGGSAGYFYEVWKCEPCCGSPANPKDAIYCLFCWHCCSLCVTSKLFAYSLGQECALFPHILCIWCFGPWVAPCLRYNLRKRAGVRGNICGDLVCLYFCGCCSWLQQLRSVPVSAWDINPPTIPQLVAPDVKLLL